MHRNELKIHVLTAIGLWACLGFVSSAHGAESAPSASTSLTTTKKAPRANREDSIAGALILNYSNSLIDYKDERTQTTGSGLLSLGGRVLPNWSLQGRIGFQQDLKESESNTNGVTDFSTILAQRPMELAAWLEGQWMLTGVYPFSEVSRNVQNFQGALGTRYSFALTPQVLAAGFETSMALGASRSFHQFETDKGGKGLNQYSIRESLNASYTYKRFMISAEFIHAHLFSYQNKTSQIFQHSQEIGYVILPKAWKVAVGHTNSGSWLKPNETDSNLDLVDENASMAYLQTEIYF